MGTRAWVKFPLYSVTNEVTEDEELVYIFGKHEGNIFVYVPFDGDTLPIDVQTALQFMYANPTRGNLFQPEGLAAWLVAKLQSDYGDVEVDPVPTMLFAREPNEGMGMTVDFKSNTVSYENDPRVYTFPEFVNLETGVVFSADPEDDS